MKITVSQETFIRPLQLACSIVERRSTLPILSTLLLATEGDSLSLTSTDMELEIIAKVAVKVDEAGAVAIPARKLLDFCRSLASNATITLTVKDNKATIRAGKSRVLLATLPSKDFPQSAGAEYTDKITLPQMQLKSLFDQTSFAMGNQDVRYYLNGLLLEREESTLRAVATDGHRLALGTLTTALATADKQSIIIPRKAVIEIGKLLSDSDAEATIALSAQQVRVELENIHFTSKLIDGKFPNYERVLPVSSKADKLLVLERELLRQALSRVAILSSDKQRSVRIDLTENLLKATVTNQEQETAEEELVVEYSGDALEIGFNNGYLLDLLGAVNTEKVTLCFSDSGGSLLVTPVAEDEATRKYVVMPMRI